MINKIKLLVRKYLRFASQLKPHYFYSEISKINRCDVLLFCHDVDRGLILNGLAYSPLIDSIYEELANKNIKCQSISLPWSKLGSKKSANKSVLFNRAYLIQLILNKMLNLNNFDVYKLIFEKSQAKLIIGIGLTSDLCSSAKKCNIRTIELLHGIGYTFIPWGWDKLDADKLPNTVLVLDDVSIESFKPLKSKGLSIIKVPHPFHKKILDPDFSPPNEWTYTARPNRKNILITLQWGYDGEINEFDGILINGIFYSELELLIKKREDFFWHFRLHPVQMKDDISNKAISLMQDLSNKYSNIVWEKSSTVPLTSVASVCDAHITMSSMSCYDAAFFGLPSLVICPTTRNDGIYKNYFMDLVSEGYVIKEKFNLNFIENWLDNVKKKKPRSLGICDIDAWESLISEVKSGIGCANEL